MQIDNFYATAPGRTLQISDNDVYYDITDEFTLTSNSRPFEVEMVVELSYKDFSFFVEHPMEMLDFINDNKGYSFYDSAGSYHGLIVLGEGRECGYILDPTGYYRAFVPFARQLLEHVYPKEQNASAEMEKVDFTQSM